MRRRGQAFRRDAAAEKGAAMMEFAFAFLLFIGLIVALMEFARTVYAYNVLAGAAREASRYAAVHGSKSGSPATEDDVRNRVRQWAIGLDAASVVVNTTWLPSNSPGSRVRVEVSYSVSPVSGLVIQNPITVGSRSEMMISQ